MRRCYIGEGKRGFCLTRLNQGGKLYTLVYGVVASSSINPIEKKRVFHYLGLSQLRPTPVAALEHIQEAAYDDGLHCVYLGNVPGHVGENTYCHQCLPGSTA